MSKCKVYCFVFHNFPSPAQLALLVRKNQLASYKGKTEKHRRNPLPPKKNRKRRGAKGQLDFDSRTESGWDVEIGPVPLLDLLSIVFSSSTWSSSSFRPSFFFFVFNKKNKNKRKTAANPIDTNNRSVSFIFSMIAFQTFSPLAVWRIDRYDTLHRYLLISSRPHR